VKRRGARHEIILKKPLRRFVLPLSRALQAV